MPYIDSPIYSPLYPSHKKAPFFWFVFSSIFPQSALMVPEMEKPRVTEIKVRMDCNGCVQKIKKALNGITGIYDIYVDFSQQKITIIGWADPEKLVKAIKKTRKSAIICVHREQSDQTTEQTEPTPEGAAPEGGAPPPPPPPEPTNPPAEPPQTEATPPAEAPNEQPQPENPPPESANATSQSHQPSNPEDLEEVHVIHHHQPDYGYRYPYGPNVQQGYHHHQPDYGYRYPYGPNVQQGYGGQWNAYHGDPGFRGEPSQPPQPLYVTHSYNTYKPSPYVTEYAYPRSPPRYSCYSRSDYYSQDYYYSGNYGNGNGNITSMFSEENPNACRIV